MDEVQRVCESWGRKTTFEISLYLELNSNRMDLFSQNGKSSGSSLGRVEGHRMGFTPPAFLALQDFPVGLEAVARVYQLQTNLSYLDLSKLSPNGLKPLASSVCWDRGFHNLITPGIKKFFLWSVLKPLPDTLIRASPFLFYYQEW